ncbi:hypothetical protein MVEN_00801500 [Mycena venus]|uniref:Mid2 domain-containing protein n=1 Tax=Mycena venus TaxID=2733690 RepID=A0A8H6YLA8_9AGAR|nr:hypothetical protein MVEN_00801500 [Mycena venus]
MSDTYNYTKTVPWQAGQLPLANSPISASSSGTPSTFSMKISNPTSSPLYIQIEIAYTVEPGDPREFFFEVVDNTRRIDYASKELFSVSGSFNTIPGDTGPHFIEAYNATDIVGTSKPFAVGPIYTVLPPLSGSTTVTTTTHPVPTPTTSTTSTVESAAPTPIASKQTSPTPAIPLASPPTTLSDSISNKNTISAATPPVTTFYQAIPGNITVQVQDDTVLVPSASTSTSTAASFASNGKSVNSGVIIGAAITGAVVLAALIFFLVRSRRRHDRRPESFVANSPPTIDPFLSFITRQSEKHRGFTSLSTSAGSPTSYTTSNWSDAGSREERPNSSSSTPGSQMEWVLRPTNDPPPGYNLCL